MSTEIQPLGGGVPDTTDEGLALLVRQAEAMDAAHKLATALCNTAMVPQVFRSKPDDAAAAILYGAELGLKPQQALQQVFVVHGQPAIYARTMAGLLKAKGYCFETVESTDESVTVTGTSPRGETETSTWSIDRAKKAGYTSNKKYASDPQAMLYAKALSEVCRKLAPDVLLGIRYTAEDLELEPRPVKATARRMDGQGQERGADAVRAALEAKKQQTGGDRTQLDKALAALAQVEDREHLDRIITHAQGIGMPPEQLTELAEAAATRAEELPEQEAA
ncbi:hypothetical protein H7347_07350 [Corynebacterium sp. zg-331]|uniref:hypothetical protein n=1 Tax=unclassified Corynebacterium TaxID=2624378 RepID=UPI00128E850E|nr:MULTISPECIES: hypothetical protein [unclassified Corynebacterium]MBC3186389.1 hypothetical protein [Corynebacterium sp. zg-331]MPV52876.1 hypothetical protein [Corynebacterium sp. zg331]